MILPSSMRVLIVDDNEFARATALAVLMQLGLTQATEAASGADAISMLLSDDYDVLLTDWYMPEVSGAGLIKIVRSAGFGANRDIPIIVMTAYASRENIGAARALDIADILIKPLEQAAMATALARAATAINALDASDQVFLEE